MRVLCFGDTHDSPDLETLLRGDGLSYDIAKKWPRLKLTGVFHILNKRGELLRSLLGVVYRCLKRREPFELSDVKPDKMPRSTAWRFLKDLREAGALEMVERGKYGPTGELRMEIEDKLR